MNSMPCTHGWVMWDGATQTRTHGASVVLHPDQAPLDALVAQPQKPLAGVEEVPSKNGYGKLTSQSEQSRRSQARQYPNLKDDTKKGGRPEKNSDEQAGQLYRPDQNKTPKRQKGAPQSEVIDETVDETVAFGKSVRNRRSDAEIGKRPLRQTLENERV